MIQLKWLLFTSMLPSALSSKNLRNNKSLSVVEELDSTTTLQCLEFEGPHLTCSSSETVVNVDFERKGACASTDSNWQDCNDEENRNSCLEACTRVAKTPGCCSFRAHMASGNNGVDENTGKYGCLFSIGESQKLDLVGDADAFGSLCESNSPTTRAESALVVVSPVGATKKSRPLKASKSSSIKTLSCSSFEGGHLTCSGGGTGAVNVDFQRKGTCASTSSQWRDCDNEENRNSCLAECSKKDANGCCSYRAHLASGNNGIDANTGKYGCLYYPGDGQELQYNGNTDIFGSICLFQDPDAGCSDDFTPNKALQAFEDTAAGLEDFKGSLSQYIEEGSTNYGRRRELAFPLLAAAAKAIGGALFKAGPAMGHALNVASFGLGVFGATSGKDDEILAEMGKINQKLDALKQQLEDGFESVVNEISLVNAEIEFDFLFSALTGIELDFQAFSRTDLTDDTRAEYKMQLRQSCNQVNYSPADIFRSLYGHACDHCTSIDGGSRKAAYFLDIFKEAANKKALGDAARFRRSFAAILLSGLSRAMAMHSACLPLTEELQRCEDPVWSNQLEQMGTALEEVAETIMEAERSYAGKWVQLRSAKNPRFCLDAKSAKVGENMHLWECHGGTNQQFRIDESGRIHSKKVNNRCLDPEGPSTANGSPVQTWECLDNYVPMKWKVDSKGRIRSAWDSNKCIDVSGGGMANGQKIHMWSCHDGDNQVWV